MAVPDPPPSDLEGFVLDKLVQVIGEPSAAVTLTEAKRSTGLELIARPEDVAAVGRELATQGGFVGIVGDLLVLTAARWRTAWQRSRATRTLRDGVSSRAESEFVPR